MMKTTTIWGITMSSRKVTIYITARTTTPVSECYAGTMSFENDLCEFFITIYPTSNKVEFKIRAGWCRNDPWDYIQVPAHMNRNSYNNREIIKWIGHNYESILNSAR